MTHNARSSIDIAYSPSVKEASIRTLRSEIENRMKVPVITHALHQRSETPMTISILLASAAMLLRVLGLPKYFKTSMRERSPMDSRIADDRRMQSVRPSHWLGRPVDLATDGNVRAEMRPYVEREAVGV